MDQQTEPLKSSTMWFGMSKVFLVEIVYNFDANGLLR